MKSKMEYTQFTIKFITTISVVCFLLVCGARSNRMFRRGVPAAPGQPVDGSADFMPTTPDAKKTCINCRHMVFDISCSSKYNSKECYGCKLNCRCKDESGGNKDDYQLHSVGVTAVEDDDPPASEFEGQKMVFTQGVGGGGGGVNPGSGGGGVGPGSGGGPGFGGGPGGGPGKKN